MKITGLDVEDLRKPLTDTAPAGINLRVDENGRRVWATIRDLRDEARRIERDADRDPAVDRSAAIPIWSKMTEACVEVLLHQSRDLAVAAYLIEALCRTDGFRGLTAGCEAAEAMVQSHWEHLFPEPDPDDGPADESTIAIERARPLVQLAGDDSEGLLVPAIVSIPLVDGRDGERFGLSHWRSSRKLLHVDNDTAIETALKRGGTSPQRFAAAVDSTDRAFLKATFQEVRSARLAWEELAATLATASHDRAVVPTLPLRTLFDECEDAMKVFAPAVTADSASAGLTPSEATDTSPSLELTTPHSVLLASAGGTREDILRSLESAAEFFERHDPHSLLAAQVRNVVRMARLPRAQYYRELIGEEAGLQSVARLTGLQFESEA